jgi:hypothetical protein
MNEFSLLASLLLLEASDDHSQFRHYLCSLPRHVPLPFYWTLDSVTSSVHAHDARFLNTILSAGTVMIDTYLESSRCLLERTGSARLAHKGVTRTGSLAAQCSMTRIRQEQRARIQIENRSIMNEWNETTHS